MENVSASKERFDLLLYGNKELIMPKILPAESKEKNDTIGIENELKKIVTEHFFTEKKKYPITSVFKGWSIETKFFSDKNLFLMRKADITSYLFNILLIEEDINLLKTFQELSFILETVNGIYEKVAQVESKLSLMEKKQTEDPYSEIKVKFDLIAKYYDWMIYDEKSLTSREVGETIQQTMLTSLLLFRLEIKRDSPNEVPYFELKDVSFVYPEQYSDIVNDENEFSPSKRVKKIETSFLPYSLLHLLNRFSKNFFTQNLVIPKFSLWEYEDTRDITKVFYDFLPFSETEAFLVTYVTDSRFAHPNLEPSMIIPVLSRKVSSSLAEGYSWHSTIGNTQLNSWNVSQFVPLSNINSYKKIEDIPLVTVERQEEEKEREDETGELEDYIEVKEGVVDKYEEFKEEKIFEEDIRETTMNYSFPLPRKVITPSESEEKTIEEEKDKTEKVVEKYHEEEQKDE